VWITKYRRKVLNKQIKERLQEILKEICKENYIRIIKLGFEEDHVHLYISIPVTQPIPMIVQKLKGGSSFRIKKEFTNELKKHYWKKNKGLWAVGYFIATVGEVSSEIIKRYIEKQGEKDIQSECIELNKALS
jgi:putative transposase